MSERLSERLTDYSIPPKFSLRPPPLIVHPVSFLVADLGPTLTRSSFICLRRLQRRSGRIISTRTKAALAAAKARGVKRGGPKLAHARKAALEAFCTAADSHAANVLSDYP